MKTLQHSVSAGVLVGILAAATPALAVPIQWTSGSGGNDHYNEVITTTANWNTANTNATTAGGYRRASRRLTKTTSSPSFWISRTAGPTTVCLPEELASVVMILVTQFTFVWTNGDPFGYSNFSTGDPNGGLDTARHLSMCGGVRVDGTCNPASPTLFGNWIDRDKTDSNATRLAVDGRGTTPIRAPFPSRRRSSCSAPSLVGLGAKYRRRRKA